MQARKPKIEESWNPWRSVAMESFVNHWKVAEEQPSEPMEVEESVEEIMEPETEDGVDEDDEEEWVLVEKPQPAHTRWTREMTDTEFNRVFQLPLPHNYGRVNVNPTAAENYLKTFNIKADPKGVYSNTLKFKSIRKAQESSLQARPKTKAGQSLEGTPRKKLKTAEIQQHQETTRTEESPAAVEYHEDEAAKAVVAHRGNSHVLFYRVDKTVDNTATAQHNMFDVLAWPEPGSNDAELRSKAATTPTETKPQRSSLDPRNYAFLDPSCTELISPAGIKSPKSEPIELLVHRKSQV